MKDKTTGGGPVANGEATGMWTLPCGLVADRGERCGSALVRRATRTVGRLHRDRAAARQSWKFALHAFRVPRLVHMNFRGPSMVAHSAGAIGAAGGMST